MSETIGQSIDGELEAVRHNIIDLYRKTGQIRAELDAQSAGLDQVRENADQCSDRLRQMQETIEELKADAKLDRKAHGNDYIDIRSRIDALEGQLNSALIPEVTSGEKFATFKQMEADAVLGRMVRNMPIYGKLIKTSDGNYHCTINFIAKSDMARGATPEEALRAVGVKE